MQYAAILLSILVTKRGRRSNAIHCVSIYFRIFLVTHSHLTRANRLGICTHVPGDSIGPRKCNVRRDAPTMSIRVHVGLGSTVSRSNFVTTFMVEVLPYVESTASNVCPRYASTPVLGQSTITNCVTKSSKMKPSIPSIQICVQSIPWQIHRHTFVVSSTPIHSNARSNWLVQCVHGTTHRAMAIGCTCCEGIFDCLRHRPAIDSGECL